MKKGNNIKKALIYVDEGQAQNLLELVEVIRQIYEPSSEYLIYVTSTQKKVKESIQGCDYWIFPQAEIASYDISNIVNYLEELHREYTFDCMIIPATYVGRMLAPRLAMRLHVGLVADVTSIKHLEEQVVMVRPAFDGKIMAGIVSVGSGPLMMSVRPGAFVLDETITQIATKEPKEVWFAPKTLEEPQIVCQEIQKKEQAKDIRESEVLISGGGGVGQQFEALEPLAKELNGMVSASRSIVDAGIVNRSIQVGQSGKTVSPKLYIALGIYGSLQHVEGLRRVPYMIAVNTNKYAPICSLSDIVVEGDALEFVEKLRKRIEQGKREG